MILFFDTVSPLPEFCLIEDNKILFSKRILDDPDDKMSDCLVPAYIELEKKFKLGNNLKHLIIHEYQLKRYVLRYLNLILH